MTDVILVLIIVAFFAAAALLVSVLGRMIDSGGYDADLEGAEDAGVLGAGQAPGAGQAGGAGPAEGTGRTPGRPG